MASGQISRASALQIADWTRELPPEPRGDLAPARAAAVQAVLEAMGKNRGPEDARAEGQRFHDALQEACAPQPRAGS